MSKYLYLSYWGIRDTLMFLDLVVLHGRGDFLENPNLICTVTAEFS